MYYKDSKVFEMSRSKISPILNSLITSMPHVALMKCFVVGMITIGWIEIQNLLIRIFNKLTNIK